MPPAPAPALTSYQRDTILNWEPTETPAAREVAPSAVLGSVGVATSVPRPDRQRPQGQARRLRPRRHRRRREGRQRGRAREAGPGVRRARQSADLRRHARAADRAAGARRRRQGRRDPQDPRVLEHPERLRASVQGADRRGERARFPVARPPRDAGARADRALQPLALRGRDRGARPPAGAAAGLEGALRADQRLRAAARPPAT